MKSKFLTLTIILFLTTTAKAAIERDTLIQPVCDTIIDKKGTVSAVKIVSITDNIVKFTQCSNPNKKQYSIFLTDVKEIKSNTFKKPITDPPLKRLKRNLIFALIAAAILAFIVLLIYTGAMFSLGRIMILLVPVLTLTILINVSSALSILKKLEKAKKDI